MRKLLVLAVTAALLGGACGTPPGSGGNPEAALDRALDNLVGYEGVTISYRIDSDVETLTGGGRAPEEEAQKVLDSSVTISSRPAYLPEDSQAVITVNLAGNQDAVELRVVGNSLYVRGDLGAIQSTFGIASEHIDELRRQLDAQPGYEFVDDLVAGNWVAFTGMHEALNRLGGGAVPALGEGDEQVVQEIADALKESTSVEEGDKEGPGTNLVVSVPLRATYENVRSALSSLSFLPAPEAWAPASTVPDKTITVDTWVQDDRLTQISFDSVAITEQTGGEVPLGTNKLAFVFGLAEFTGTVEAPAAAAEADIMTLIEGLMSVTRVESSISSKSTLKSVPAAKPFCSRLKDQLEGVSKDTADAIVDQYGKRCPKLTK